MIATLKSLLRKTPLFDVLGGVRSEAEWLRRIFGSRIDVFFLQIGAHDGKTDDYIYPIAWSQGWHGVLVEPVPSLFKRLVENYADSDMRYENAALARQSGTMPFYRLRESDDPRLPKWYDQLGSFNKNVVFSHRESIPDFDRLFTVETVECITCDDLCRRHSVTKIDLILIDTEGYDLEILRTIDFHRLHPTLVIYEQKHLSNEDKSAAQGLLKSCGYKIYPIGSNNAAVLRL